MSQVPPSRALPPIAERFTALGWLYRNLFSPWYNILLTLLASLILYAILKPTILWILNEARWEVIGANLRLLAVGQYPADQVWRIWLCLYLLVGMIGLTWGVWMRMRRLTLAAWLIFFPLIVLIIRGLPLAEPLLPLVPSHLWGGLLLTLLLTVVGMVFSFPIGVVLALGRQSKLPVVRLFSVAYIELVRGVPLIAVLFMAQLMLPLFLPAGITIDRVLRAMVGITLFSAAYMAENVRGGLQAIPKGQHEAAHALGLSGLQTMMQIILPQALRAVIPVLVGQFIGLFKDTSLVAVVGLLDLLGIANSVLAQPAFIGRQREVYLFICATYWLFSYTMSYASQRLEIALGVGQR